MVEKNRFFFLKYPYLSSKVIQLIGLLVIFNDSNVHHFMLIRLDRCGDEWRSEYNQNG